MASSSSIPAKERAPRKRGPNYTEAEKLNLRMLAKRYNKVLESKATGSLIFKEKADAWLEVTKSYNACSTSGIRTTEQLKHAYENMKQVARKSLATSKKADYLHKLEEEKRERTEVVETLHVSEDEDVMTVDLEKLKHLDQSDKIARQKTGGGSFIPTIQEKDLKILELIKDQVEPLSNPFDSAASYFNDDLIQETADEATKETEIIDKNPKGDVMKKNIKTRRTRRTGVLCANKKTYNYYKKACFKKKYENSILERRRLYQDIRLRQKEHILLAKKLKLEIEILEKQK